MTAASSIAYDFVAPPRICFGWGRRREVGTLGRTLGRRAFLICGSRTLRAQGALDEIADRLRTEHVDSVPLETISHEPEVDDVDRVAAAVRRQEAAPGDFVLALGGGAAIDLAKAVAAMATNRESPTVKDYLEVRALEYVAQIDPDDFTRWVFPRLFHSRVPRYEAIARPHGYTVSSEEVAQVRDERDFLLLLETAIARAEGE